MAKSLTITAKQVIARILGPLCRRKLTLSGFNSMLRMHGYSYRATYVDDFNLITRMNAECISQERFQDAINFASIQTGQTRPLWTSYILIWAAENAMRINGAFVECGVEKGFHAKSIIRYLNLNETDRKFYLFDSWEGVDLSTLAPEELTMDTSWNEKFKGFYEEVRRGFEASKNVYLIRGFVPETLYSSGINEVAFLHIDLNSAWPESEAIKFFWNKLVPGAIIICDDYCQPGRVPQKAAIDRLGTTLGYAVASLPTGQGLIVKC